MEMLTDHLRQQSLMGVRARSRIGRRRIGDYGGSRDVASEQVPATRHCLEQILCVVIQRATEFNHALDQ